MGKKEKSSTSIGKTKETYPHFRHYGSTYKNSFRKNGVGWLGIRLSKNLGGESEPEADFSASQVCIRRT